MALKINGNYIYKRGKWYHYKRRVPALYRSSLGKDSIRCQLNTDSELVAKERAHEVTRTVDEFLSNLDKAPVDVQTAFKNEIDKLKFRGFKYKPYAEVIAETTSTEFANRLVAAHKADTLREANMVMGITKQPQLLVSNTLKYVEEHHRIALADKNPDQLRRWKNPKIKAINNFIIVNGDKSVEEINREDILEFKRWWVDRILDEKLTANSANKDFSHLSNALRITSDNLLLKIPVSDIFSNIRLAENDEEERRPFPTDHIENVLLKHDYNTHAECKFLIFAMADTGCRPSELTGLDPSAGEIRLDTTIPYIKIQKNKHRTLKTPQSRREIPLVGAALHAFKELAVINAHRGGGFDKYFANSTGLSATVNKYLQENDLRYSDKTTLYSLRHSLEDRLQATELPEKVHCSIFGHKYNRERYGDGPTLGQKKKWLDKIAFNV